MAVTSQQIIDFLLANPGMSDAQIVAAMEQYGVSPAQMATAVGLPEGEVVSRVAATIPELSGLSPSTNPAYFTTSLLTTTITSESSPPELWIADWTAKKPRFSRVGPSK